MKPYHKAFGGWLARTSATAPSIFDENVQRAIDQIVRLAMDKHLRSHSDDDVALFTCITPSIKGDKLYVYVISAVDAGEALDLAKIVHEILVIAPSDDWMIRFPRAEDYLPIMGEY